LARNLHPPQAADQPRELRQKEMGGEHPRQRSRLLHQVDPSLSMQRTEQGVST